MGRNITTDDMGFSLSALLVTVFTTLLTLWCAYGARQVGLAQMCNNCMCLSEGILIVLSIIFCVIAILAFILSIVSVVSDDWGEEIGNDDDDDKDDKEIVEKKKPFKFKVGDKIIGNNKGLNQDQCDTVKGNGYGIVSKIDDDETFQAHWWDLKKTKDSYWDLDPENFDLVVEKKPVVKKKPGPKKKRGPGRPKKKR